MGERFHSERDAINKLNSSVCMYEGIPHSISVDADISRDIVKGAPLNKLNLVKSIVYTSDEFDYGCPDLGYMYSNGHAHYLSRYPVRVAHEGLRISDIGGAIGGLHSRDFYSVRMYNCIMGKHKSFKECLKVLEEAPNVQSIPFHRHGALFRMDDNCHTIRFDRSVIATYVLKTGEIVPSNRGNTHFTKKALALLEI